MTWLQIIAQIGIMATFVGAGLALAAYFNGKHIKAGVSELKTILTQMTKTSNQQHQDVIASLALHREDMKLFREDMKYLREDTNKQHQEVVELLKRGFGEVLTKIKK